MPLPVSNPQILLFLIMAKLKQISAKIDKETLAKIDQLAGKKYYWSRNMIINQILTAVFDAADGKTISHMLTYWQYGESKPKLTFDNG